MTEVFKYKIGNDAYKWSSRIPTITIDGKEVMRHEFWEQQIQDMLGTLPTPKEGETPVYIATGGGYGSYNELIDFEKKKGLIPNHLVSLKGGIFYDLPIFDEEKKLAREQAAKHIGEEGIQRNPQAIAQTVSSFYADETNTRMAKGAVNAAFPRQQSVIHESASIYPDTIERAQLAQQYGITTVLVAGDKDVRTAVEEMKGRVEPFNTATSYQKFAARFETELMPLFDEIRLYNTDGQEPKLIAQKKSKEEKLEILNQQLYAQFINKKYITPETFKSATVDTNVIAEEHRGEKRNKAQGPT